MQSCFTGPLRLVTFSELWTAPWVQAWGSMVGAALGAGLAVGLAIWFQGRAERSRLARYNLTLRIFVHRLLIMARGTWKDIEAGAQLSAMQEEVGELLRDKALFARMSPFADAGNPQISADAMDLTVQLERTMKRFKKFAAWPTLQPAMKTELLNMLARVTDGCETVIEAIDEELTRHNPEHRRIRVEQHSWPLF